MTVETEPIFGSCTEELYDWVRPIAYADGSYGYVFKRLAAALAEPLQPVDDIVRGNNSRPGWAVLWNVDDTPDFALPFLAQAIGTTLSKGTSADTQRATIRDHANFRRGTPATIVAATQLHLTATKTVVLIERFGGDPYHFYIQTLAAETPSSSQTQADILAAKPIGLTFEFSTGTLGKVWDSAVGTWDASAATTTQWDQADTSGV